MNDSLDYIEELYSKDSKEKSKDIESHPAYLIMSCPLGNHEIEKAIFTRLRLGTSIIYGQFFFDPNSFGIGRLCLKPKPDSTLISSVTLPAQLVYYYFFIRQTNDNKNVSYQFIF